MKIKLPQEQYSPSIKASEHCSSRVAKSYQLLEILDLILAQWSLRVAKSHQLLEILDLTLVQCRKKYLCSCGRSSAT